MAQNNIAKKTVHEDMTGVTIEFSDGASLTVNLEEFSEEIIQNLALHGLSQKLGDSYSGEQNLTVARGKAEGVAQRLRNGDWKAVRESSGGGRITDLAQALANVTGRSLQEAVEVVDQMDKDQKKELRRHPQIKAETTRIAAERAQAAVKGTDQLELGAIFS